MPQLAPAAADPETRQTSPLAQIEALAARVRAGELAEDAALARIATLVRDRTAGEIYQKPLG